MIDLTSLPDSRSPEDYHWDFIQLAFTGSNGNLPNMDMISFPMEMFPDILRPESDASDVLGEMPQGLLGAAARYAVNAVERLSDGLLGDGSGRYRRQFFGMLRHLWLLVSGPTGLHGQFLSRNIDSITLRPVQIKGQGQGIGTGGRRTGSRRKGAVGLEMLFGVVNGLVSVGSNLHGEIHVPISVCPRRY